MKKISDISDLISRIKNLGKNFYTITEIKLFGSQTIKLSINSDIDVLIILTNESEKENILKNLSELTLFYRILVHPIILTEDEFKIRKNINIFSSNILNRSSTLYSKAAN